MDDLENLKKEIEGYAKQKGIKVLEAYLNLSKYKESDLIVDEELNWKSFLDIVGSYESSLIALTEVKFDKEEDFGFDGDLEILRENQDFSPLIKEFDDLVQKGNDKVYSIAISWVYQGKTITKTIDVDWFETILKLVDQINMKYLLYRDENKKYCEICGKELDEFTLESLKEGDPLRCGMCKRTLSEEEREKLKKESDKIADELSKDKTFTSSKLNVQKLYVEKNYPHIPKNKVAYIVDRARGLAEISKKGIF